jgi:hypothetical protein
MMISSSCDGSVSFWSLKDSVDVIHPSSSTRFLGVPLCLCAAAQGTQGVFVGFKDGSVRRVVMLDGKCADSMSLPPSESGVARLRPVPRGHHVRNYEMLILRYYMNINTHLYIT